MIRNCKTIAFATWNVNFFTRSRKSILRKIEFIRTLNWDVIALQEVTSNAWEVFREEKIGEDYLHVFDLSGISPNGPMSHGAALISRNGFLLREPEPLPKLPRPERGLGALTRVGETKIALASWHAPNASGDGVEVKMAGYQGFIDWLNSRVHPTIVGFDSNHWERWSKLEPPPVPDSDDPWLLENRFFGSNAPHELKDAFVEYLKGNPSEYAEIIKNRPNGPLEISYLRKSLGRPIPERMDYIFVSRELSARSVRYHYNASVSAGSDHALVLSEVEV